MSNKLKKVIRLDKERDKEHIIFLSETTTRLNFINQQFKELKQEYIQVATSRNFVLSTILHELGYEISFDDIIQFKDQTGAIWIYTKNDEPTHGETSNKD